MRKIIIGIHGLGNKPHRDLLEAWWKKSILDGLNRIGCANCRFKFELVYWAHVLHSTPLDPKIKNKDHKLYLEEPYHPVHVDIKEDKNGTWKRKILDKVERTLDKYFFEESSFINFDTIADIVIRKFFKDLYCYYYDEKSNSNKIKEIHIREAIRGELKNVLNKYKKYKILLIAHSMGTIISYDVLTQFASEIKIDTFVTLGSPLSLPVIVKKILKEQNIDYKTENKPRTPENIKNNWYNFSDPDDRIAINYTLADDFKPNSKNLAPIDALVENDYEYEKKKNPHKAFGYLQTAEVAEVIHQFLKPEKETLFYILKNKFFSIPAIVGDKIRAALKKNK